MARISYISATVRHVLYSWLRVGSPPVGAARVYFTVDHDIPYRLGYTPIEDDARHMAWLRRDVVGARLSGVPFDYPLRLYTFQLANYFIRGSEYAPSTGDTNHAL